MGFIGGTLHPAPLLESLRLAQIFVEADSSSSVAGHGLFQDDTSSLDPANLCSDRTSICLQALFVIPDGLVFPPERLLVVPCDEFWFEGNFSLSHADKIQRYATAGAPFTGS